MEADPDNVIAIHCKGGKGLMIDLNSRFNDRFFKLSCKP